MGKRRVGVASVKARTPKVMDRAVENERMVSQKGPEGSDASTTLATDDIVSFRNRLWRVASASPTIVVLEAVNGDARVSLTTGQLKNVDMVSQTKVPAGRGKFRQSRKWGLQLIAPVLHSSPVPVVLF